MPQVTMKMMCEHISKADFLINENGTKASPSEIFNYSPTGELSEIFYWYQLACEILGYSCSEKAHLN